MQPTHWQCDRVCSAVFNSVLEKLQNSAFQAFATGAVLDNVIEAFSTLFSSAALIKYSRRNVSLAHLMREADLNWAIFLPNNC